MNYHLKRTEREISDPAELALILKNGKFASIAMCYQNEPYIVTLNYGYDQSKDVLYFHNAQDGLKLDFISQNPDVCGTVVEDHGYVMGECEHKYRSVVFRGSMSIVDELEEKKYALRVLIDHLEQDPAAVKKRILKNDDVYENVGITKLEIQSITGKAGQ
ncbi:flavin-nucleotide-binding protein [candidate division KSB1 bacterium]|nr:flavin-nucleotide-binding protein [candidate division KSB1 bacterium]